MANYWTLLIGIPLTIILYLYYSPVAGITAGIITLIIFTIRAIMNYRNPELIANMVKKKNELHKKWGITETEDASIENGVPATATITRIGDAGTQLENKLKIRFTLDVKPKYGQSFQMEYKKYISFLQIPQFQAGKELNIKFNPKDKSKIEFVSFTSPEGKTIYFTDYKMD